MSDWTIQKLLNWTAEYFYKIHEGSWKNIAIESTDLDLFLSKYFLNSLNTLPASNPKGLSLKEIQKRIKGFAPI